MTDGHIILSFLDFKELVHQARIESLNIPENGEYGFVGTSNGALHEQRILFPLGRNYFLVTFASKISYMSSSTLSTRHWTQTHHRGFKEVQCRVD